MLTEKQKALKPLLTDDFLNTLVEAAKIYGWSGDYIEVCAFVDDLFEMAGKDDPDLNPYK